MAGTDPPNVPDSGPAGARLLELLIYDGHPFKNHWAFFVRSGSDKKLGNVIHATGDVRNGFTLQIKRNHDFAETSSQPMERIRIGWIEEGRFNDEAFGDGKYKEDYKASGGDLEESMFKVAAPEGSLNKASEKKEGPPKRVDQRDCQTWVAEAGAQLAKDGYISLEAATFLSDKRQ
eukprot:TRINITY_DN72569_c0_g1_i1.p1 TRINITY_DN72569_c0_g1~~TRINITY_DN72569_c0_g1_i1.p1  ORF type:complete len:176 (-),score=22.45 TRINITY_DN72569_c0_g1_i1:96-623(-)